ncbi:hypothetical protein SCA6_018201 [Theobroma cacao]
MLDYKGTAVTKVKMAQKEAQGVAEKRKGRRGPGSVIGSSTAGCDLLTLSSRIGKILAGIQILCVAITEKSLEEARELEEVSSVERNKTQTPRYLLRSMSKENKKPPIAVNNQSSVISTGRKPRARRVKRV